MKKQIFGLFFVFLFACSVCGQERPIAFINARIIPIVGQPIEQGVLIVQNGKITAVGDARTVRLASNVEVVDMQGKTIMPGLVDTHSHIGEGAGADASSPIQPDVRLLDSLNVRASSLQRAQSGGITTVNVMPGSGQARESPFCRDSRCDCTRHSRHSYKIRARRAPRAANRIC